MSASVSRLFHVLLLGCELRRAALRRAMHASGIWAQWALVGLCHGWAMPSEGPDGGLVHFEGEKRAKWKRIVRVRMVQVQQPDDCTMYFEGERVVECTTSTTH